MRKIDGDLCHDMLAQSVKQKFAYDDSLDFDKWRSDLKKKFIELIGTERIKENACPLNFEIESEERLKGHTRIRFVFDSEKGSTVPCYLLIPDGELKKRPLCIVLQGHSTGFHNSIGVPKFKGDSENYPGTCFGNQAVSEGFLTLCIEQRAMGERKPRYPEFNCGFAAQNAILLGRTLIGERLHDTSMAIDVVLKYFSDYCDEEKIMVTGNSGGGTASYYFACYDERVKLTVPSCAFCSYKYSIMPILHCGCNYIPNAFLNFEMGDLAGLVAPRNMIIVAGKKDDIFLLKGVEESYNIAKRIYKRAGCEDKLSLVLNEEGHYWNPENVWSAVRSETKKMGWNLK